MPLEETIMNLLLIEKDADKVALIRQELDANMVHCHLNIIGHGKSALAYLRQIGLYKSALVPDLVLFDFSNPDRESWSLLKRFGFDSGPVGDPNRSRGGAARGVGRSRLPDSVPITCDIRSC